MSAREPFTLDYLKIMKRCVVGYDKIPTKNGGNPLSVIYYLKPIELSYLRKLFNINMNSRDPGEKYVLDNFHINEEQAKALQPYVIDGVIDLENYYFMLETNPT